MRVCFCVLFWTGLFTFCVVFDLCIVVLLFLFVRVVFIFFGVVGFLESGCSVLYSLYEEWFGLVCFFDIWPQVSFVDFCVMFIQTHVFAFLTSML
jgi:hypothetical protein